MTRKLATIQRIKQLLPIDGADMIEVAIINGWQVVTQKGQHMEGDLVVFYEIDSFLPASDPRYASFEERFINWDGKRGMRLKSIRLRKQLSQGLIMPVSNFAELLNVYDEGKYAEGADVTDILKIEKWEVAEKENTSIQASKTRSFPYFIRKTDEERIQNYGKLVEQALDEEFEFTIKRDGSSLTVFRVDPSSDYYEDAKASVHGKLSLLQRIKAFFVRPKALPVYGICSRNVLLPLEGNSNFHTAAQGVIASLKLLPAGSYAVQGELTAPDIQGNYEKVAGVEFDMFNLFDIDKQVYVLPEERRIFAATYGIPHITLLAVGALKDVLGMKVGDDIVKAALAYAEGPSDNPAVKREGFVAKAMQRDFSFKAVATSYLLSTGK